MPFIDLSRAMALVRSEALAAFEACYDKRELVGGASVRALEGELSSGLSGARVVCCANGTDALVVALRVAGVGPGSRVAIPNLTFWATYEAVVALGAVPVVVDVDPVDLQLDVDGLRAALDGGLVDAVLTVHLYGWASGRVLELRALARDRGVPLVEDGAQAFGVLCEGASLLGGARLATLSFYPAKVLGGVMDGGAVIAREDADATLARALCDHGRVEHYAHAHAAYNSRMAGLQAAYLRAILPQMPALLERRRALAGRYRARLGGVPGVRVFGPPASVTESGYLNVVTIDGRSGDDIVQGLAARGVGAGRVYPIPIDAQPGARGVETAGPLDVSRRAAREVASLPLFHGMTDDEHASACDALVEIAEEGRP